MKMKLYTIVLTAISSIRFPERTPVSTVINHLYIYIASSSLRQIMRARGAVRAGECRRGPSEPLLRGLRDGYCLWPCQLSASCLTQQEDDGPTRTHAPRRRGSAIHATQRTCGGAAVCSGGGMRRLGIFQDATAGLHFR